MKSLVINPTGRKKKNPSIKASVTKKYIRSRLPKNSKFFKKEYNYISDINSHIKVFGRAEVSFSKKDIPMLERIMGILFNSEADKQLKYK